MKTASAIAATTAFSFAITHGCDTPRWGSCGNSEAITCCPDFQYCQPWTSSYYQCRDYPAQCGKQLVDWEIVGEEMAALYNIQPDECCARCASTSGCVAYTFVNNAPGSPACFLKSGMGTNQVKKGAVTGIVSPKPPTRAPTAQVPNGKKPSMSNSSHDAD